MFGKKMKRDISTAKAARIRLGIELGMFAYMLFLEEDIEGAVYAVGTASKMHPATYEAMLRTFGNRLDAMS